jgi:hypothetical protein
MEEVIPQVERNGRGYSRRIDPHRGSDRIIARMNRLDDID